MKSSAWSYTHDPTSLIEQAWLRIKLKSTDSIEPDGLLGRRSYDFSDSPQQTQDLQLRLIQCAILAFQGDHLEASRLVRQLIQSDVENQLTSWKCSQLLMLAAAIAPDAVDPARIHSITNRLPASDKHQQNLQPILIAVLIGTLDELPKEIERWWNEQKSIDVVALGLQYRQPRQEDQAALRKIVLDGRSSVTAQNAIIRIATLRVWQGWDGQSLHAIWPSRPKSPVTQSSEVQDVNEDIPPESSDGVNPVNVGPSKANSSLRDAVEK